LIKIETSEPLERCYEGVPMHPSSLIPFKEELPRQLFSRKYLLYNQHMAEGDHLDINPYIVLDKPALRKIMDNFYLFRSDVELELLITASPLTYGYLTAVPIPMKAYSKNYAYY